MFVKVTDTLIEFGAIAREGARGDLGSEGG